MDKETLVVTDGSKYIEDAVFITGGTKASIRSKACRLFLKK